MTSSLLSHKTYATFDGGEGSTSLPEFCLDLLSEQKRTWRDLREGSESLKAVEERDVLCRGFTVRLQHNSARIKNSTADVDKVTSSERRCFLCLHHLPQDQKWVLYRREYLILCNPRPILSPHFTISHANHRPQAIADQIESFLRLTTDFGPGWDILYNGSQCGASAPDHLHFHAVPSGRMPIEEEIREKMRLILVMENDGIPFHRVRNLGREVILLEGENPVTVGASFREFVSALKQVLLTDEEPMMNVAGYHDKKKYRLVIFPRRKHRPDAYFREGAARVVVSPGIIDMGGVLVTPVEKDFERLDAAAVENIYAEVSLDSAAVEKAVNVMQWPPVEKS
jgi:hypothetical protein